MIASAPSAIAQNANGMRLPQAAHLPNVLLVVQRVDDDAGPEKELRLEERVREEVQDPGLIRADADADDHVADLRHRRISQHALDIPLRDAEDRAERAPSTLRSSRRARALPAIASHSGAQRAIK